MADRQLFDRADADHRFHDLLLIAAFAANDANPADEARARGLTAACADCAELVLDLQAIAATTGQIAVPRRPRDFRLRPEDAQRLKPHGFGRVAAAFGGRRLQLARPLATGLTMLGIAGILVSSLPSFSLGGSAASAPQSGSSSVTAAAPERSNGIEFQGGPADGSVPGVDTAGGAPSGRTRDDRSPIAVAGQPASPVASARTVEAPAPTPQVPASSSPQLLRLASVVVLVGGLALLLVSSLATRGRLR